MKYIIMFVLLYIINLFVTMFLCFQIYKIFSDQLYREKEKTIIIECILQGLLEGKDRKSLLKIYEENLNDLYK